MKKLFFPLLILCISATISCKKEMAANNKVLKAVSSDISKDTVASVGTFFGAKICNGSNDERIEVLDKLGVGYIRSSTILTKFDGKEGLIDDAVAAGKKVILNLIYSDKHPSPYPTDMVKYKSLLRAVLDKYASKIEVAVIENEPTTDAFYGNAPIENYLTELRAAIEVCHEYGVKVADGCVHDDYVQQIITNKKHPGHNTADVKTMIAAYKNMDLDYVNVHTKGRGSSYPAGQLKSTADYLRAQTGHPVMSNEWHLESNEASLVESMVKGWEDGGYVYSLIWGGGDQSDGVAINNGTTLLSQGIAYRNSVD